MGTRIVISALTRNIREAMKHVLCFLRSEANSLNHICFLLYPWYSWCLQKVRGGPIHLILPHLLLVFLHPSLKLLEQHPGAAGVRTIISTTKPTSLHSVINLIALFITWLSTVLNMQIAVVTYRHPRFCILHQQQRLDFDLVT